jgi:hypothetical protein
MDRSELDLLDERMRQLEEEIERAYFKLTGFSFWGLPNGPGENAAAAREKLRRADPAQRAVVSDLIDELAAIRKRYCGLVDLDVEFCVLETRRLRRPSKEGAEEEGE